MRPTNGRRRRRGGPAVPCRLPSSLGTVARRAARVAPSPLADARASSPVRGSLELLQPDANLVVVLAREVPFDELAVEARRSLFDQVRRLGAGEALVGVGVDQADDQTHEQ